MNPFMPVAVAVAEEFDVVSAELALRARDGDAEALEALACLSAGIATRLCTITEFLDKHGGFDAPVMLALAKEGVPAPEIRQILRAQRIARN